VGLTPLGEKSVCPGTNDSITVTCNLTWTPTNLLRWDVRPNGVMGGQSVFYSRNPSDFSGRTLSNVGEIQVISMTSNYVVLNQERLI